MAAQGEDGLDEQTCELINRVIDKTEIEKLASEYLTKEEITYLFESGLEDFMNQMNLFEEYEQLKEKNE